MDTASNSLKRLYLFDIDGTLITSGGAGEASLKQATKDFCGKEIDFSPVTIAGNTVRLDGVKDDRAASRMKASR